MSYCDSLLLVLVPFRWCGQPLEFISPPSSSRHGTALESSFREWGIETGKKVDQNSRLKLLTREIHSAHIHKKLSDHPRVRYPFLTVLSRRSNAVRPWEILTEKVQTKKRGPVSWINGEQSAACKRANQNTRREVCIGKMCTEQGSENINFVLHTSPQPANDFPQPHVGQIRLRRARSTIKRPGAAGATAGETPSWQTSPGFLDFFKFQKVRGRNKSIHSHLKGGTPFKGRDTIWVG